ncbi:MAG: tRNA (adenosine(37)-N6)-threonylcarbamoyltransferase complex transferase subunit TsaD [Candidatus Paceibacterota bacterium]
MKILSIETSCDETGISILEVKGNTFRILGNVLNSQIKIHAPFGGVFPALAKREHMKNLPILLDKILKSTKLNPKQIDLIAVTSGPGLEPALWTGIVFAKELSKKWNIPIVPVNHMEGHLFSVFVKNKEFSIEKINFPALSLLVSGGHTELVLIKDFGKYQIIGETLDDASGEAFDKVARMLELPYPGGPYISKLAESIRGKEKQVSSGVSSATARGLQQFSSKKIAYPEKLCFSLPRPMMYSKNFDFSFSGLKTAVLYLIRDLKKENPKILENENIKKAIALEFENAVVETLIYKTRKAIEKYKIKTLIVAGGVSANKYLKKELQKLTKNKQKLYLPTKKLSGDNALMIGIAGYYKFVKNKQKTTTHSKIKALGGLRL